MSVSNINRGSSPKPIPSDPAKAGSVEYDRAGCRIVGLYMPFEFLGRKIEQVIIGPFNFDLTARWREGEFPEVIDLLIAMCEDMDNLTLRQIKYPDFDRVMMAFMDALPQTIRNDIIDNNIPKPTRETPEVPDEVEFSNLPKPEPQQEEAPPGAAGTGIDLEG